MSVYQEIISYFKTKVFELIECGMGFSMAAYAVGLEGRFASYFGVLFGWFG